MKKFWIKLWIGLLAMVGIAVANNVVLLKLHPLSYYYTPAGMLITAIVSAVESAILWPTTSWYINKFLVKSLHEEMTDSIISELKEL